MRLIRRARGHRRRTGSWAKLALVAVPVIAAAAGLAIIANPAGSTPAHPAAVKQIAKPFSTWIMSVEPSRAVQYQTVTLRVNATEYDLADPPTGEVSFMNDPNPGSPGGSYQIVAEHVPVQSDASGVYAEIPITFTQAIHYGHLFADYNLKGNPPGPKWDPDYYERFSYNQVSLDVDHLGTTTTLAVDKTAVDMMQTIHVSSTVAVATGSTVKPSGDLEFQFTSPEGVLVKVPVPLSGEPTVSKDINVHDKLGEAGNWSLKACYVKSTNAPDPIGTSCSEPTAINVTTVPTTTTLTVDPSSAANGQDLTFTAKVAATSGSPAGTVTFNADGTSSPVTAPLTDGVAIWKTNQLGVGSHQVVARYDGNTSYHTSSSDPVSPVVKELPKVTVEADNAAAKACQQVTFTATVGAVERTPTGSVDFTVDGKVKATVQLVHGQATWTTKELAKGTHQVVVKYAGSGDFAAIDSTPFIERIAGSSCGGHPSGPTATPTPHSSAPPAVHGGDTSKPSGGGVLASTGAKVGTLLGGSVALLSVGLALTLLGGRRKASRHRI